MNGWCISIGKRTQDNIIIALSTLSEMHILFKFNMENYFKSLEGSCKEVCLIEK